MFHNNDSADPDIPYTRTFYPSATELSASVPIRIGEGQGVVQADIRAAGKRSTKDVEVLVHWDKKLGLDFIFLTIEGESGCCATEERLEPDRFSVTLFKGASYRIYAWQHCGFKQVGNTMVPLGERQTDAVEINTGTLESQQVNLWLRDEGCKQHQSKPE